MTKQNNLPATFIGKTSHPIRRKKRGNHDNLPAIRNTGSYHHKLELLPSTQAEQLAKQIEERLLKSLPVAYKPIKPPVWTKPDPVGSEGAVRNLQTTKKIIHELQIWANDLPEEIGSPLWDALDDLNKLMVTCWTEIDEALLHMSISQMFLKRWLGRKC